MLVSTSRTDLRRSSKKLSGRSARGGGCTLFGCVCVCVVCVRLFVLYAGQKKERNSLTAHEKNMNTYWSLQQQCECIWTFLSPCICVWPMCRCGIEKKTDMRGKGNEGEESASHDENLSKKNTHTCTHRNRKQKNKKTKQNKTKTVHNPFKLINAQFFSIVCALFCFLRPAEAVHSR